MRGEEFYQYGPGKYIDDIVNENIIMFFSGTLMENLKNARIICIDGTFSKVPLPYYQLFTVSYLESSHVFPTVYVLLKNKVRETYVDVFKIIHKLIGHSLSPQ